MTLQTAEITEAVLAKLQDLPLEQQQQVLDFVEFIAEKHAKSRSNEEESSKKRVAGLHKGKIWISDDFNDPLELREVE
jgi:mRNA-degrading endonuclease RelE of RelBE toxin-antitoxin system